MRAIQRGLLLMMVLFLTTSGSLASAETVRIQLKWFHQFQFAGYYAALEKGYFAEEGLQVELIERDIRRNNIQQVLAGEAEYGIADSAILLYQQQGAPLRIVAPIFQHSPNVIVTRADSGILSPQDLVGRRVRLYNNETDGFPIMAMLAEQGVLAQGVIRQPYSPDLEALIRNETDAIFAYSSNEPFQLREKGLDVRIIHPAHYGIDMYGDMLFSSESEAIQHPERVQAMRRAVLRGWEYALDNKLEIAQLIREKYSQRKSLAALMFEAHAIEQAVDRFTVPLGTLDSGRLQYIAGIYQRHGLLDDHFRVDRRMYFDRAAGEGSNLTDEESLFLDQNDVIRVAVDPSWYPMEFVDESGQHGGIAADYLALLSQRLGIRFEIAQGVSWAEAVTMVRERELDMFAMAARTPERDHFALFTQPYIRSPMVIVTDMGVDYIDSPVRLHGKKVAVVRGYASHEWLASNQPEIPLRLVDTTVEGLERVATGEVYALVDNLASVTFLIKQRGLSNLKVSGQLPLGFDLAMGVRSDWPELRTILQKGLDAISQEERDAIYDKWVRLEVETRPDLSKVAPYFIALLLILALVSLDAWRVRRLHRRLQEANRQLHLAEQRLIEQNHQLELLSITDKLTGAYNRLKLDEVLQQQHALAERYKRPVSVVMFDLDDFKRVNDTHGHHAGDLILRRFTELVLSLARKSDVFGRWGGEEFLLICPETTALDAADLANRVRVQLAEIVFEEVGTQTVSSGIAELRPSQSVNDWISHADKRLYQAKQQGRNRVVSN